MKRWEPIAYPGPVNAQGVATHRNFNQATAARGSWPDADGYQQNVIDEPANLVEKSGFVLDEDNPFQTTEAVRSQRLNYSAAGGAANALTVTLDPAPAAYADLTGTPLRLKIANANTAAATLNVNGLGAKAVLRGDGSAVPGGYLLAGEIVEVRFDGADFRLDNALRRTTDKVAGDFAVGGGLSVTGALNASGGIGVLGGGAISLGANAANGFINTSGLTAISGRDVKAYIKSDNGVALELNNTGSSTNSIQAWSTDVTVRCSVPSDGGFHVQSGAGNPTSFSSNRNAGSFSHVNAVTGGSTVFAVDSAGNIYSTNTSITPISDRNLKKDIAPFAFGLSTLLKLRTVEYRLRSEADDIPKKSGFIAQEIEELIPAAVRTVSMQTGVDGEGEPTFTDVKTLSMDVFIPLLVNSVQQLSAQVEALTEQLAGIEKAS
ncbi:tail fiber domain-containing protein [Bosea sp. (in: a-proteobacteria)]|uniref:tail fiber domain-containing protein n=1 Tax=Bosea sp. (in: a-proteobacteria) TaxID=1871050 RepID=UPI003B3A8D8A